MLVPEIGPTQVWAGQKFWLFKSYVQVQLVFVSGLVCAAFNDTA